MVALAMVTAVLAGLAPGFAHAGDTFTVAPTKLDIEVPENGSGNAYIYITSEFDGELFVDTEGIPFRIEPDKIRITSTDLNRRVELSVYGDPSLENGVYSGKVTFLAYKSDTVAYGVKLEANVTQVGRPHSLLDKMMRGHKALVFIIVGSLAAAVGIPLGLRMRRRKELGRKNTDLE
ncbi:MAG: hypothetical protein PHI12_09620 [Dehalococcoidales bacterium]|nr:hypothetical protein [Dehalococcoidales bacterium]